jgi:DMSO/TMAO reductase YedYZ heme-binding membrane subunit
VATTRSRPRGRETARPNSGGAVAEHMAKIWGIAIVGVAVIVAFLALTSTGHVIDLAVQHFMLFYAGVFALIALCASVAAGLVATDRMVLNPGHRVWIQSAHRAISFGAVAFLIIHIVTEILAQRVHVIDAVVPFMSPFRTFYIGIGTVSSDLIILLVITGILRKRFTGNGKNVWRWRAIHYTSYVAFVFGVWHGLLGGRPGKPYVDWSYGFVVAFVALGLAVRILANSLRSKESLSAAPVSESAGSGSAPLRAAAMLAQVSALRSATPAAMTAVGGTTTMLPAAGTASGPMRAVAALPAGSADTIIQAEPVYEPGYEGPPRYQGAPRPTTGPMQVVPDSTISGPLPQVPSPQSMSDMTAFPSDMPRGVREGDGRGGFHSGGFPSGGFQGPPSGPMPTAPGPISGPMPTAPGPISGPMPTAPGPISGPMPTAPGPMSGPVPQVPGAHSGPFQRPATGPMPRVSGAPSGGFRRPATGPVPRVPGAPTGGFQGPGNAPAARMPGTPTGGFARPATGPMQQAAPRPIPPGQAPRVPGPASGGFRRPATGPMPQFPGGMRGAMSGAQHPMPQPMTGQMPPAGDDRAGYETAGYEGAGYDAAPQWDGPGQEMGYGFRGGDELR